jgi:hypothetical protein
MDPLADPPDTFLNVAIADEPVHNRLIEDDEHRHGVVFAVDPKGPPRVAEVVAVPHRGPDST